MKYFNKRGLILLIEASACVTEQCMIMMNASKSRYLPVFDVFDFKGIITIHDLMRAAITGNR